MSMSDILAAFLLLLVPNNNNNNNDDDDDDDDKQSFRSYLRKRRLPELDIIRSVVHPKSKANVVFISVLCKKKIVCE